jgi:hypothetical protein
MLKSSSSCDVCGLRTICQIYLVSQIYMDLKLYSSKMKTVQSQNISPFFHITFVYLYLFHIVAIMYNLQPSNLLEVCQQAMSSETWNQQQNNSPLYQQLLAQQQLGLTRASTTVHISNLVTVSVNETYQEIIIVGRTQKKASQHLSYAVYCHCYRA